jgi:lipopolysaccharide export LptBFGC system permease protein LptF
MIGSAFRPLKGTHGAPKALRMFPAPVGLHTQHMLGLFARNAFLIMGGVVIIALSIDLAKFLPQVLAADIDGRLGPHILNVGWYIVLRSADQVAEWLPLSCFLGVLWSEVSHTRLGERLIISMSGRSPLQCLAPTLIFSFLIGAVEIVFIVYLRPAAVTAQIDAHWGWYGQAFNRSATAEAKWMTVGDAVVSARVQFDLPALHDVRVYRIGRNGQVQEILIGKLAVPLGGFGKWHVSEGWRWKIGPELTSGAVASALGRARSEPVDGTYFADDDIILDLNPLWLQSLGVPAKFLPNKTFRDLGLVEFVPYYEYRTWSQARYAIPVTAAAMIMMADGLCLILLIDRASLAAVLFILLAGYGTQLLTKLFLLSGFNGWIHPVCAAWSVPFLVLSLSPVVYLLKAKSRSENFLSRMNRM